MSLAEDEIAYRGSVGDVNPSINVSSLFTSIPGPFTSWDDIGPPHVMKIQNSNTHQIYMVRQLPTPRSYWLVLINQGNNTNKEEEKTLLNSTLHTQALSTALSRYPSLCSLCVLHTHTRSSSLSIYVYKWE